MKYRSSIENIGSYSLVTYSHTLMVAVYYTPSQKTHHFANKILQVLPEASRSGFGKFGRLIVVVPFLQDLNILISLTV